jgi:hypothetical protein
MAKQKDTKWNRLKGTKGDVGSNTTLHCKRKDLNRCSPTQIPVQTEIDIAEWEE